MLIADYHNFPRLISQKILNLNAITLFYCHISPLFSLLVVPINFLEILISVFTF